MRHFQFFFFGLSVLAVGVTASADSPNPHSADVAAYDSILAGVAPGQTTVALGDMVIPVATVQLWRDQLAGGPQPPSASSSGINLWPGANVYYAFNANVTAAHQQDFLDAAGEWMAFANVHFIARTTQANYVMVNDGGTGQEGGDSAVGMIGGQQQLDIGSTSWNRGTLLHEIGHTLGLIHEHQRSDRDTYVTINFSNVPGGTSDGNFILIPTSTNNGPYDFLSIMHYARKELAVNPAIDTITPNPGYTQFIDIMGNNPDRLLSRGDRDGMAVMYGAGPAVSTIVTNTQDSGAGALRTAIYYAFDLATDTPGATPTISFQIPNTDPNFSGATNVTTDSSGNATFSVPLPATVPAGQFISATATDPAGNTSEFAGNVTVTTTDSDGDGIPDAWMIAHFGNSTGLASDKSRATDDADGTGMTNLQKFRAGLDPHNSASVFRLANPSTSGGDLLIGLPGVAGFIYRIDYADDLLSPNHWHTLADQISGTGSTLTITDPGATALQQRFYRAVVLP